MGNVYFARVGRYVKIGYASNVSQRMKTLLTPASRLVYPADFDAARSLDLVKVIPGCRMRDERNAQVLFGRHWSGAGEWFHWSPAFRFQMESMQFVTHAERLAHLRRARRALGIVGSAVKEWHDGKQTPEILAESMALVHAHQIGRAA